MLYLEQDLAQVDLESKPTSQREGGPYHRAGQTGSVSCSLGWMVWWVTTHRGLVEPDSSHWKTAVSIQPVFNRQKLLKWLMLVLAF